MDDKMQVQASGRKDVRLKQKYSVSLCILKSEKMRMNWHRL